MKTLQIILLLASAAFPATITGRLMRVEDSAILRSMKSVKVTLTQGETTIQTVRPNQMGFYRFENVTPGEYTITPSITVARFVFDPETKTVTVTEDFVFNFLYSPYGPCFIPCVQ